MFRRFPIRFICLQDQPTAYNRVNEKLTAVLSVGPDGKKMLKSLPKNFEPTKELGIFYYSKTNWWNTRTLWERQIGELNRTKRQQIRKLLHVGGNCAPHIGYNDEVIFKLTC